MRTWQRRLFNIYINIISNVMKSAADLTKTSSLTCRGCFSMDGRCGGDEGGEEEGSQGSLGEQGRALRGQILTAAHAAVDLKVQGLGLLLGSEGNTNKEGNMSGVQTHRHQEKSFSGEQQLREQLLHSRKWQQCIFTWFYAAKRIFGAVTRSLNKMSILISSQSPTEDSR